MGSEHITLLLTKLNRPRLPDNLIHRPHLIERLKQGLNRKLTLISAPAGYGKSTLIVSCLETCPYPAAWLSLAEADNDLIIFVTYVVATIQTLFPGACPQTLSLLRSPQAVPPDHLATTLINEAVELPGPFILVLDDYHWLKAEAIDQFLTFLLDYLPPQMHVCLITRQDPPLPLGRLRARQEMTEIRQSDLCFSTAETQAFLEQFMGSAPPAEVVAVLAKRAEGWVVSLHLAALSLRLQADPKRFIEEFSGTNRYIMEYLTDEILQNQPRASQDFLLKTAILHRFCGPLCDAVIENNDPDWNGQAYLTGLAQANFLLIPLDEENHWYRYHYLFQDLLYHKLKTEVAAPVITALYARASAWCASHGLIEEALNYTLLANRLDQAAELVAGQRHDLLNRGTWRILENWLDRLPESLIQQSPSLLMARVWILNLRLQIQTIPPLLEQAETLLERLSAKLPPAEVHLLRLELNHFWGVVWYWRGDGQASFNHLHYVLQDLPEDFGFMYGHGVIYFGLAAQITGQTGLALQLAHQLSQHPHRFSQLTRIQILGMLFFIHLLSGNLTESAQWANEALRVAREPQYARQMAWNQYLLGYIHYVWNHLETALAHLTEAAAARHLLDVRAGIDSLALLALTHQAMARSDQAAEAANQLVEFAVQVGSSRDIAAARSFQARLWLRQGDNEAAFRWQQSADLAADIGPMFFWAELPRLTECRALMAEGTPAALSQAAAKLEEHLQMAEATYNTRQIIEVLLLQALAYQAQAGLPSGSGPAPSSGSGQALAALERAVTLARPGGFIRSFVDYGPPMAHLLRQLAQQGVAPAYIHQILAAFGNDDGDSLKVEADNQSIQPSALSPQPLIEPLTLRELEILDLLAQRWSYQEIADVLYISVTTVKSHAHHIYQKLDVSGRSRAVSMAKSLGLLPNGHK
jgi:LuxR family maltose regulon positive regulatory protein